MLARSSGQESVRPGDIAVCDVDLTVLLDIQFINDRLPDVVAVHDPDKVAIVMDHAVPAAGLQDAAAGVRAREFARKHKIGKFFDVGAHGIVHEVLAEQGLALPGHLVACTDSHTCAAGAYNCAARGLGPAEIIQMLCTGTTWHQVPRTIRYDLRGRASPWINGKDIFLHIAGTHGDATNHALEFGGDGLASVSMSDRRTIATQGAEVGADFSIFPADQTCLDFIDGVAPGAEIWPMLADPNAEYAARRTVELDALEPMLARPGTVINNTDPVSTARDNLHRSGIHRLLRQRSARRPGDRGPGGQGPQGRSGRPDDRDPRLAEDLPAGGPAGLRRDPDRGRRGRHQLDLRGVLRLRDGGGRSG